MIVPRRRAIALTAGIGGAVALVCAAIPSLTLAMLVLLAILAMVAVADAITAAKAAKGLSIAAPQLIRAVRSRRLVLPLTLSNRGAAANLVPRLALLLPAHFSATEAILDGGTILRAGQLVTIPAELRSAQRGEYRLDSCSVRTESRFGLWAIQNSLPISTLIRAYPDLLADSAAAQFLQRGGAGSRVIRHTGRGREFEKLREYLAGDSWDEIDWKATARRGMPVVRVFQVERTQEIYVALDASRLSGRLAGAEVTLERYVHAALVMALAAESQGDRFGLITFSDRIHTFVRAGKGKAHFKTCRDAIYQLQPRAVEPDFGEFFAFLQTRLTRRALVIVLTALDDPLAGETFNRYVSVASKRHLVIAGMPAPEGARPLFETPAESINEIYDGLGGHLRWRQLAELKKSCQHKGVALHLLNPEKLTGQLAGIYLDVKRRQSL